MEYLFSYGTLQDLPVQQATFGRALSGTPDSLPGYALSMVEIDDPQVVATSGKTHHPIVRHTGSAADAIEGTVFLVTDAELRQSDEYEVDAYVRVSVLLASGLSAWVYVDAAEGQG